MKKIKALLMAFVLFVAGVSTVSVKTETTNAATNAVTLVTTMDCSVWSAPNTSAENKVKSVSAGYSVTVYPIEIKSTNGDGKTFYQTVKGNYILCKCFDQVGMVGNTTVMANTLKVVTTQSCDVWSSVTGEYIKALPAGYTVTIYDEPVSTEYGVMFKTTSDMYIMACAFDPSLIGRGQSSVVDNTIAYLAESGKKYHNIKTCGRMNPDKALKTTVSRAESYGYEKCAICWGESTSGSTQSTKNTTSTQNAGNSGIAYLPANGSSYHRINNCGRMNPSKAQTTTVAEAQARGFSRCSKCW